MACRRCSTCAIDYPAGVTVCHVCGDTTDYLSNVTPGDDWQADVEFARCGPPAGELEVRLWRREQLGRLGFGGAVLDVLVEADTDVHRAQDLIGAGCPVETAARILI